MPLKKHAPLGEYRLTGREREVCLLIAKEALEDKEIAARLGISARTVGTYLRHIFQKLRIDARERLIILYYRPFVVGITPSVVSPARRPGIPRASSRLV